MSQKVTALTSLNFRRMKIRKRVLVSCSRAPDYARDRARVSWRLEEREVVQITGCSYDM